MNKFHVLILFLLVLMLTSCGGEETVVDLKELPGRWILHKAERNGKETSTLDKAFFEISETKFSHNLEGDSVAFDYSIEDKTIKLKEGMLKEIDIIELHSDTLAATSKIGDYSFNFLMTKNANN